MAVVESKYAVGKMKMGVSTFYKVKTLIRKSKKKC